MNRIFLTMVTAVLAFGLVVQPAVGGPVLKNKYAVDSVTVDCADSTTGTIVGTITYDGPLKLWPPNHKYQAVSVTAAAIDPDDNVSLNTQGTHEEYLEDGSEQNGAGNTDNDVDPAAAGPAAADGTATTNHALRSERSGNGDGRTYTLDWEATFTNDDADGPTYTEAVCASPGYDGEALPFIVSVPHDMRGGADWKG